MEWSIDVRDIRRKLSQTGNTSPVPIRGLLVSTFTGPQALLPGLNPYRLDVLHLFRLGFIGVLDKIKTISIPPGSVLDFQVIIDNPLSVI